jgi:hypothetical protein
MLTDRAKEHLASLDDGQLAEYIAAGELMYEADAIEFARDEFSRRNLDQGTVALLEAQAQLQLEAEAEWREAIAAQPLDGAGKVLAFVGGLLGLAVAPKAFFAWLRMDMNGERQKARDVKRWFLAGLVINIVVLVVWLVSYSGSHAK